MQVPEILAQQHDPRAGFRDDNPPTESAGLRPIEAALWEIALQIALSNQKIEALIATVEKVALRNGGGR